MYLNKLRHIIKPTTFTYVMGKNYQVINKFTMEQKKTDLIIYGNEFGKNDNSIVFKRENVKLNRKIWTKEDSLISKNCIIYDTINPFNNVSPSNQQISSTSKQPIEDSVFLINTSDLKKEYREYDGIETKDNSRLMFKKIQEIEEQFKKNDGTLIAHIFTDRDFIGNSLHRIKKRGELNDNLDGSNIFFVESSNIDKQCCICTTGELCQLDDHKIDQIKNINLLSKNNDGTSSPPTSTSTSTPATTATTPATTIYKTSENLNNLAECSNCHVIQDKQANQFINLAKKADIIVGKSRLYYLPHFIVFLFLLNAAFELDTLFFAFTWVTAIPLFCIPFILAFVLFFGPLALVNFISSGITTVYKKYIKIEE